MKHTSILTLICILSVTLRAQTKDFEKAMAKYEKYSYDSAAEGLEGLERKSVVVRRTLAESYIKTQDFAAAESELAAIMQSGDKTAEDVLSYAEVLKRNGKYDLAQQSMMTYYELMPADGRAQEHRANPGYHTVLQEDKGQFKVTNLDINSEQEDFGPAYYRDQVVFASSREGVKPIRRKWNWNRLPFLDMYVAEKGTGSQLSAVRQHHARANMRYHEGPASFDASGNYIDRKSVV